MDLRKTNYLLIVINFILILCLVGLFVFNLKLNNNLTVLNKRSNALISQEQYQNQDDLEYNYFENQFNGSDSIEQYQNTHDEFSKAVASNDPNKCSSLDETFKVLCLDGVYLNLAIKEGDKDLCEKITSFELKEVCLQDS